MKKSIVIFEVKWWSDKWKNGYRKDTMPIVNSLKNIWINSEVIFFEEEKISELIEYCKNKFDWYITRVNPWNLKNWEKKYFEFLQKLSDFWLIWMSTPSEMMSYGAKDALIKLKHTNLVPNDTFAYYNIEDFKNNFPKSLKENTRVLKQNRGSTGNGIWRVEVIDERDFSSFEKLPFDTKIKCTEAVDNHVENRELWEFMNFCEKYLIWENAMIIDMKFLARIVEWEIRILFVWEEAIFVIHKLPVKKQDAFSATLFSGAKYTYESPKKYKKLLDIFENNLAIIKEILGNNTIPLIWTADFILDTDNTWKDLYILWEINCSCVGFTSHLEEGIQEKIAKEVERRLK